MASSSSLSPPSSSLPSSTSLSHTHPPPSSTFSTTDVLQRSFDTFNALLPNSHASSPTIDEAALKVALQLLASTPSPSASPSASPSPPSSVPVVSPADARAIMDIVAGPDADRLTFSQFHNVYAAVNILNHLSKQDLPHLRLKDVKRALISAGINPTQAQLDGMMVLGDQYSTFDKRGQLEFKEFLRIYNQARTNPAHVFLHSWFAAGRNSTAMRKPVEVSPMQDFLAGTAAGVSLTLVGHPFDTSQPPRATAHTAHRHPLLSSPHLRTSASPPRCLSVCQSRCGCRRSLASRVVWTVCYRRCATRVC